MIKKILLILLLTPFFVSSQIIQVIATQKSDTVVPPPVEPPPAVTSGVRLGELKVFPHAFGGGEKAGVGQASRTIYEVTSTSNGTGAGTFRDAISVANRDILIRTSGTITGGSTYTITANNIRIYGQTSPSGFAIHDNMVQVSGADHISIQGIRFRGGDAKANSGHDSFRIIGTNPNDIIMDYCSISWGDDENWSISMADNESSQARRIGLQNSIISEAFRARKGLLLYRLTYDISINRNYFAHNGERNIRSSTRFHEFEFNNNVIYGAIYAFQPTYENKFDFIGNTFKSSPNTSRLLETLRIEASTNNEPNGVLANTIAHSADNQENGGAITNNSAINPYLQATRVMDLSPILPRAQAATFVIANAGAKPRDAVDAHVIADYTNSTGGLVTNESQTPGIPDLTGGVLPTDADSDYISDAWETSIAGGDINPLTKPTSFIINAVEYDNREYSGGEWEDETFNYVGGTLTGNNLYTWREIYFADLIGGFKLFEINN